MAWWLIPPMVVETTLTPGLLSPPNLSIAPTAVGVIYPNSYWYNRNSNNFDDGNDNNKNRSKSETASSSSRPMNPFEY